MADPSSLLNIGGLTQPVTTLIEKISAAIAGLYEPYQIVRVAHAEATVEKIRAEAQIEVTDLQRRAMLRFVAEEAKKQSNIETITRKALPDVTEQAKPEQLEDDWITNFFDKCRLISDDDMQILWARILAGEANSPGSFSKRAVNLLASLDKSDAVLFSKLCSFGFQIGEVVPLIYDTEHEIYIGNGISFMALSHLESIGLVHFDSLAGYRHIRLPQKGFVYYFGKQVWVEFPKPDNNDLDVGYVLLTQAGQQLAPICGAQSREGFVDYVREKWRSLGYKTPEAEEMAASDRAAYGYLTAE